MIFKKKNNPLKMIGSYLGFYLSGFIFYFFISKLNQISSDIPQFLFPFRNSLLSTNQVIFKNALIWFLQPSTYNTDLVIFIAAILGFFGGMYITLLYRYYYLGK